MGACAVVIVLPVAALVVFAAFRKAVYKWGKFRGLLTSWHWLWFFVLASGFILRVRDSVNAREDPADAAALFRVALMGVVALALTARLAMKKPDWLGSLFTGLPGALTLFALAGAVSTLWSVNPPWTFYKSIEFLIDAALIAAFVDMVRTADDYKSLFDWNWILCGLLIASAWVGAAIWPQEALHDKWDSGKLGWRLSGLWPGQGANRLGDLGAILGAVCVSRLFPLVKRRYDRFWYALILLASLATILASQTRTAFTALCIATALVFFLTGRIGRLLLAGGAVVAVGMLAGVGTSLTEYLERGQTSQEIMTLSARLTWWSMALDMFRAHPWTGVGAFAAGSFGVFEKLGTNNVGPLHSDYIEALVGTSAWGLIPLLIAILGTWWVLIRSVRDRELDELDRQLCMEAMAVYTVITIRSVFMTFITMHPPLNFTILLGYAEFIRRRRLAARFRIRSEVADVEPVSATS
jgi:O-antigen ligase